MEYVQLQSMLIMSCNEVANDEFKKQEPHPAIET